MVSHEVCATAFLYTCDDWMAVAVMGPDIPSSRPGIRLLVSGDFVAAARAVLCMT